MKRLWTARHYIKGIPRHEAGNPMDESTDRSQEEQELTDVVAESHMQRRMTLCSLRVVPVTSDHFFGRRYVMELATTSRARELRVFRSLEQLMSGVAELGLREDLREGLYRQLIHEGQCDPLDIVL